MVLLLFDPKKTKPKTFVLKYPRKNVPVSMYITGTKAACLKLIIITVHGGHAILFTSPIATLIFIFFSVQKSINALLR